MFTAHGKINFARIINYSEIRRIRLFLRYCRIFHERIHQHFFQIIIFFLRRSLRATDRYRTEHCFHVEICQVNLRHIEICQIKIQHNIKIVFETHFAWFVCG
ncbi:hypothetical protein PBCV1_a509R [Paramecium bursaria Chlorella virus 1]|uniref:Uncharacterized protein n=1 Tax=Paramecium bursaria Chlorella virus 1 TaxID=10506 RepID=Q98559_PBCV1|nr:hypothetical protein PBCV1_a509R [Paramecium bursaria Chlorella virus 1]AAC96876.1 hypothetical protein [Paramecium bursaria Chlorella virus 1]